ncbi:hypothetical protein [Paludisphaera soli]|uniref:hypothetical protein n=1 Tax=Paludisphaera soli TaxID=2712865 RepID=UPI0013EA6FDA|nr:hypothetical protein [Paludisphaera soli]
MKSAAKSVWSVAALGGLLWTAPAPSRGEDVQPLVRIGDVDGFGYGEARGFRAAKGGGYANRDRAGLLTDGDVLPDIDQDGWLRTGSKDNFDFRSAAEIAGNSIFTGAGVVNAVGTTGSQFTDVSLSTSYDASRAAGEVLVGGDAETGLIFGPGGPFPTPPSTTTPNQPGFVFRFEVDKTALAVRQEIYFNLLFGDYDVTPASIRIVKADGSAEILGLRQQNNTRNDGLIQAATAVLAFSDVFADGGDSWIGSLIVDFRAPNEPYTAFDFVELSTAALVRPVPEPSALAASAIGLLTIAAGAGLRRGWRARSVDA